MGGDEPARFAAAPDGAGCDAGAHDLRVRADENLRDMYRHLARGSARGVVVERDRGACLVATGVPFALFNPVFPAPGTGAPEADGDGGGALLTAAQEFYRRRYLPWALFVDETETSVPAVTPRQTILAGLRPAEPLPILVHPTVVPDGLWPPFPPWLVVRAARTEQETADHRALLGSAFGIPEEMSLRVLPSAPMSPLWVLYGAYERATGRAVGAAALCEAGGLAGVYNVAAHPDFRRRGVASALMRAVLEEARARGLTQSVLQSSPAGRAFYSRLGYRQVGTYSVYVSDHRPS